MNIKFGGECFCIHGISQIIDIFVQCYIFGKGFVSEPVANILSNYNDKEYPKFLELYIKFQNMLVSIFRSKNIDIVKEFYLIIGPNIYKPDEIIKIPITFCSLHIGKEGKCCDENCGPLNDKQQRNLYKEIVSQYDTLYCNKLKKNSKIFVYIVADNELKSFSNDIEEGDELECLKENNISKVTEFLFENSCIGVIKKSCMVEKPIYYRWQEYFFF
ncbi:Hypothetical protein SRAE_2000013100 [Strongyloides ratti]|uniref:Uncharacterized protein n=1 Tax=Strongyloides ratti TaxID=34506 RepID=A0A090L6M6_STRRB|nr:Hypothetical protein SRAE_2000013100 [Strongyloides ratti]CEF65451.1 Hypothetical protein SRAE_2000013100 [Strongyloides ratti]